MSPPQIPGSECIAAYLERAFEVFAGPLEVTQCEIGLSEAREWIYEALDGRGREDGLVMNFVSLAIPTRFHGNQIVLSAALSLARRKVNVDDPFGKPQPGMGA